MLFNRHSDLSGLHAFLSPSSYHWVNYDDEKLDRVFTARMAAKRGTDLHDFAKEAIRLGVKLPEEPKTLNMYVNDGVGFRMSPEVTLAYSENCFGTADTIAFRQNTLRIHDLKTGQNPCSFKQLEVYAALFCLEYEIKAFDISIELRIYQSNEVQIIEGDADVITHIMSKIIGFDKRIKTLRMEAMS